jgi:hypothetical protein
MKREMTMHNTMMTIASVPFEEGSIGFVPVYGTR